jgi:hypothetical protein
LDELAALHGDTPVLVKKADIEIKYARNNINSSLRYQQTRPNISKLQFHGNTNRSPQITDAFNPAA